MLDQSNIGAIRSYIDVASFVSGMLVMTERGTVLDMSSIALVMMFI